MAQALAVLKEFYANAGEETALVQQCDEPEIFDSRQKVCSVKAEGWSEC